MSHSSFHRCSAWGRFGCPVDIIEDPQEEDDDDHRDRPTFLPSGRNKPQDRSGQHLSNIAAMSALMDEIEAFMGKRGAQRVPVLVGLEQLARQGMGAIPSVANGGMAWLLAQLSGMLRGGLFGEQPGPRSGDPLIGPLQTFEGQYALESTQAATRFSKSDVQGGTFLDGFLGNAIKAVAFGGAAGATAAALKGPFMSGMRATGAIGSTPARGGGGGGLHFPAPTFRPGFQRRKMQFQFVGNPPTD